MAAAISSLSFEDALKELEAIVKKLESGEAKLEDSIKDFERGSELKAYCEKKLAEAKLKVEQIVKNADGSLSTKTFAAD